MGLGRRAWALEAEDVGTRGRGTAKRQDAGTQGHDNKQHLIFVLNLLGHSLSIQAK